eukprot:m.28119 g.28119  ORF g.28119 m.28119 type:complete len:208 (+) comp6506_c0_seq2:1117-1740(+)
MGVSCGTGALSSFEEAFEAAWESNAIFGTAAFSFDDIIDDVTVDSVFSAGVWTHTVTFEYKPESPLDHVTFTQAANSLVGTLSLPYCGCTPTVEVTDAASGYNFATGKAAKKGKCKGAFTAGGGKGGKGKKVSSPSQSSATGTSSAAVIGVVVVAVVAIVVGLVVVKRRFKQPAPPDFGGEQTRVVSNAVCDANTVVYDAPEHLHSM